MEITPETLREWAKALQNGEPDEIQLIAGEMFCVANEMMGLPDDRLAGVPELPAGLYGYPPRPQFVTSSKWPVAGYGNPWYVIGPARELLGVETVMVERHNDFPVEVAPGEVVGWRKVVKKRHPEPILYVLMTFDRIYDDDDTTPEWTL